MVSPESSRTYVSTAKHNEAVPWDVASTIIAKLRIDPRAWLKSMLLISLRVFVLDLMFREDILLKLLFKLSI
jgi:hypothetical protein